MNLGGLLRDRRAPLRGARGGDAPKNQEVIDTMLLTTRVIAGGLLLVGLGIGGNACSSSGAQNGSTACLSNPASCAAGETCWPTSSTAFACLTSFPSGTFGTSCQEAINRATCADGMICDATSST